MLLLLGDPSSRGLGLLSGFTTSDSSLPLSLPLWSPSVDLGLLSDERMEWDIEEYSLLTGGKTVRA